MSTTQIGGLCIAIFMLAGAVSAQTVRYAVINSPAFTDEKTGITRYVSASKSVLAEFKTVKDEIDSMSKKAETMRTENDRLRNSISDDEMEKRLKVYTQLLKDLQYKQDDANASYDKRYKAVVGPIITDIGNALGEFAKQKGYGFIFDISKDQNGLIVAIGDDKLDVTADFIAYYNSRPTPTAPK